MQPDNPTTAILFFSRTATEEVEYKRFSGQSSKKINFKLADQLVRHTQKVAWQTGLPVITITSAQQQGHNFAQKITHAVEQVFALNYQHVIIIGNDCPHLTTELLLQAARNLEAGEVVLGPATDGGAYVIGLSQQHFSRNAWLSYSWQTSGLCEELIGYFKGKQLLVLQLPVLADVDNAAALISLFKSKTANSKIARFLDSLRSIAATSSLFRVSLTCFILPVNLSGPALLRGPPLF